MEIIKRRTFMLRAALGGLATGLMPGFVKPSNAGIRFDRTSQIQSNNKQPKSLLHPAHPFWPYPRLTLVTDNKRHRSRGSGLVMLQDKWLFFWRDANLHNARDPNSKVMMAESRNGGQTIENMRTLYCATDNDGIEWTDIRVRIMGNGRIGIYGCRRQSVLPEVPNRKPLFAYSDDKGESWNFIELNHFSVIGGSPSFTFVRYPKSVGGHDRMGYMLSFGSGTKGYGAYTLDNGNSWQEQVIRTPKIGGEESIVQLGDSDRWIMITRVDSGEPNAVYKSTDLVNWQGPFFTNKCIAKNPSTIVYHKGHITWIAASRPYHYQNDALKAIPVDGNIFQGLVTCTADAEAIWNDPTQWPDWTILMYLPVHFDATFVEHNGYWYMLFGAIEGPMRIGLKHWSQLGLMTSVAAPGPYFNAFQPGWQEDQV